MKLKALGYWAVDGGTGFPHPANLVDVTWESAEREIVCEYLEQGHIARSFMGAARCLICGDAVGNSEFTDGEFLWPCGLGHYVSVHSVKLPAEFIEHVFRRREKMDEAVVDVSWWKAEANSIENR